MVQQDEMIIEDDDGNAQAAREVDAGQGGGFVQSMMGMFGFANQNEDEK